MFHFFIWKFPSLVNAGNWIWLTSWFSCTIYYLQSNWHYWSIIKEACIVKETIDWKVHSAILMSWMSLGLSFKLTQGNENKNWWEQNWQSSQSFHFMWVFFCTNISEGIVGWLHMAQLDNAKPERNIEAGTLEVFSNWKKYFVFQRNTRLEKTLAWSKWCTYCAHINDSEAKQGAAEKYWKEMERNITRRCREIFNGSVEKYYKELQRNILRRCWEMLCSELRGKVTFWQLRSQRV